MNKNAKERKVNRFIIFCIEEYCAEYNLKSGETYKQMLDKGVIEELKKDYEDLHGMSISYLNDYIHSLLN